MTCCDILLYMLYAFICHVFFATSNDISDITSSRTDDHLRAPSGGSPRAVARRGDSPRGRRLIFCWEEAIRDTTGRSHGHGGVPWHLFHDPVQQELPVK